MSSSVRTSSPPSSPRSAWAASKTPVQSEAVWESKGSRMTSPSADASKLSRTQTSPQIKRDLNSSDDDDEDISSFTKSFTKSSKQLRSSDSSSSSSDSESSESSSSSSDSESSDSSSEEEVSSKKKTQKTRR